MPDYATYQEKSDLCAAKLGQAEAARVEADRFAAIADACAAADPPDTAGEALNLQAAINQATLATNLTLEAKAALAEAKAALEE